MAAAVGGLLLAGAVTAASGRLSTAALETITWFSLQHIGHATTPGHGFRTLDDEFYADYQTALGGRPLQPAAAARYVARSAAAFVTVPLPWQVATRSELAYIPEQVVWYVMVAFAVVGVGAAYRRDPLFTSILVGYIVTMAAALAMINGNIGTLVRLRGLVTRFVVWIAAVGLMATITRMAGDKGAMSRLIDREGRLAGRFNIVDALCLGVLFGLIPVAYLSWLLFQPAKPEIRSVERSEITSAEERIAAGQPIRLKVKVRGDHLTPMLRASIGPVPAMGFTFEGPTSGDVIIGENVPVGTHDLILYDGPLEVARAVGAVTIAPTTAVSMRARVRVEANAVLLDDIRAGDRDIRWPSTDDRAATVETIERPGGAGRLDVVVRLGVDRASDGWRYHSQPVIAGGPFTLVTDRYTVMGTVMEMRLDER